MKRFTDAGRRAIADKNYYAALSLALMIPDICGSLEDPGPGKSRERYERWFKQWAEPKFNPTLSATECYRLRCSLIHSGSAEIQRGALDRFVFFDHTGTSHNVRFQFNLKDGRPAPNVVALLVSKFSETLYQAAEEWDTSVKDNAAVQAEKAKLLVIRSKATRVGF
jgi:hypothetical protein